MVTDLLDYFGLISCIRHIDGFSLHGALFLNTVFWGNNLFIVEPVVLQIMLTERVLGN